MHIRKAIIEHVKCLRRVELDLPTPCGKGCWIVFAGPNASGKTTLLQALALALAGPREAEKLLPDNLGRWVTADAEEGKVRVLLSRGPHDEAWLAVEEPLEEPTGNTVADSSEQTRSPTTREPIWAGVRWDKQRISPWLDDLWVETQDVEHGPWSRHPYGWLAVGYGPYRRLATSNFSKEDEPTAAARLQSLFYDSATYTDVVSWLMRLDYEASRGSTRRSKAAKRLLTNIRELLNGGNGDEDRLLPHGFVLSDINPDGVLMHDSTGRTASLAELSHGQRAVLGLLMDVIRWLFVASGTREIEFGSDPVPCVLEHGVVLIDEMELHLHPSWQQRIGFWLQKRFPNIQFLVTAHSPFICQAASPGGLIRLPAPGEDAPVAPVPNEIYEQVIYGSADDAVVSYLFGLDHAHSQRAEALYEEAARLEARILDEEATDQERQRFRELSKKLPASAEVQTLLRSLRES